MIVRPATVDDAAAAATVMNGVIAEGGLTLFDRPFSAEDERQFIASLGPRSVLHVAELDGVIVGLQSIDLFSSIAASMQHVATMGTWVAVAARGHGVGRALWTQSWAFARAHGYAKIVIQVLADNAPALRFYRGLGFRDIGVARNHVRLNGRDRDEIYLERELQ